MPSIEAEIVALKAALEKNKSASGSAKELMAKLFAQLNEALASDTTEAQIAAVREVIAEWEGESQSLADAVAANTTP